MLVQIATGASTKSGKRIFLECLAKALVCGPEEKDGRPPDPKKKAMDMKGLGEKLRTAVGLDTPKRLQKLNASWRAVEAAYSAGAVEAVLPNCDTQDGIHRFCTLQVLDLMFSAKAARCWMSMQEKAANWVREKLNGDTMGEKGQGMAALACIAASARETALEIAQQPDILDEILMLAESSKFEWAQLSAAELCAHLASEDPAKAFNPLGGLGILRGLSAHQNPRIAVRAVTALAKLANVNGTHRFRVLADGRIATRVMNALNAEGEFADELQSWAVEAMAYLSLYPEIKEPFEGQVGMRLLVTLLNTECKKLEAGKDEENSIVMPASGFVARGTTQFGLVSIIANLTSTELTKDEQIRRKLLEQGQEATVEQVNKLRQMQDCRDPNDEDQEEPPEKLTDPEVIMRMRRVVVVEKGVAAVLGVVRAAAENGEVSNNTKEMIATTMSNCACIAENRGEMVQQGVVPAMCDIAKCGHKDAANLAAQTLAKIVISTDPRKFSESRHYDMVVPLLNLTQSENGLHQFESCMALTNLASISDEIRTFMLKHDAFQNLQYLMTMEDERIMRVSTEALCNLCQCPALAERLAKPTATARNELKMFVVLAAEATDYPTRRAAAGGLAQLCCFKDAGLLENLLSKEAGVSYGDVVYVLGEMLTVDEELLHRGVVGLVGLVKYRPAAVKIKNCVLNIKRTIEGADEVPVKLVALLEMIAGGGLAKTESATDAAQEVLRALPR
jgi:hypothetical protein